MFSTPKITKELLPENELYHNAYRVDNGLVTFQETWVNSLVSLDIYCLEELFVEKGAEIHGDIVCKKCFIKGKVYGSVYTWDQLAVEEGAYVTGTINSRMIEVLPGSVINGSINMKDTLKMPSYLSNMNQGDLKKFNVTDLDDSAFLNPKTEAPVAVIPQKPAVVTPVTEKPAVTPPAQNNDRKETSKTPSKNSETGGNDSHWW
jgi:hypothetical protein